MSDTSYDKITIRFTENEVWDLVLALKERIQNRIKDDHYKRYPDSFEQNVGPDMWLLRDLAGSINRYDEYTQILLESQAKMAMNTKALGRTHNEMQDDEGCPRPLTFT